jgi:choline-sulfatase
LPSTCGCTGWEFLPAGYPTWARVFSRHAYATVACGRLVQRGPDVMQGWTQRIGNGIGTDHVDERDRDAFARHVRPLGAVKWSDAKEIKRAGVGRAHTHIADEYGVLGARNFIERYFTDPMYDRETPDRPLLLRVGFLQPHYPYLTDRERFAWHLNRVAPYLGQEVFDHPFLSQRQVRPGVDAGEREIRRATAAYYGMVEALDSYCGEMLGEHGIWEKQKFFEGSVRVPLLIRWPRRFAGGRVVEANVNLCDLFATLCDLADLPVPSGLDSRSLVRLLDGGGSGWNNESLSEFGGRNVMIKRDALKYQYYGPEMPELLFDLDRDPGETRSFLGDPAYAEHVAAFRLRLAELGHGPNADPNHVNAGYK